MMKPRQRFPHVVIRASAGTGKTYQLSNRFISLVAAGQSPDQILAATFARKAAGEILDRVLIRLAEAAIDSDKLTQLSAFVGDGKLNRQKCLDLLCKLVGRLHRLRIGTLDSFFAQLAGSFSLELGLPTGWSIVDELDGQRLREEAIQRVLEAESTADLVTLMHLLSKGDVTRSVTAEIHDVVGGLYDLYCETDEAAWDSLPRRKHKSEAKLQAAVAQLSSLELLDNRFAKARDADVAAAQAGDWEKFIAKGLAAKIVAGETTYHKKPIEPPVVEAYRPLLDEARAVLLNKIADQTRATRQLLDKFDAVYQLLKQHSRGLRFDDVTRSLVRGFETGRIGEVAWRLDTQVLHLLLDEFQDTSLMQWRVIRPFAEQVTAAGGNGSFFCVGDVKQAIYRWRGGVSEIFEAVGGELGDVETGSLTRSYRSSQPVIDTVNRVFGNLSANEAMAPFPIVAELWGERFQTHTTAKGDLPGYCRLMTTRRAAEDEDQQEATLVYAAERIAEIVRQNPNRTVGVLVRRNATVARLIYELRTNQKILASEEGGNPLTDSAAVQLILSLLRIGDHPGDTAARFHVATSPLSAAVGLERHDDDAAAGRLSLEIREALLRDGYGQTIYRWTQALAAECDVRELNRLLQLVQLGYGYEDDATARVDDFIRLVESRRVEDPTTAAVRVMNMHQAKGLQFDLVVLPELHAELKGRPSAVVVGRDGPVEPVRRVCRHVNEKLRPLLPASFQKMFDDWADQSVNESLCLLYVAMTRAAGALYMFIPPASENERTLPKRYSGLLRAALSDGTPPGPETILYEHGDESPFAATAAAVPRKLGVSGALPIGPQLREAPSRRKRGLDRQSPSALEGGNFVNLAHRLRLDTSPALSRGSLFHAWFEEVEWLDDGVPDDDSLRQIAEQFKTADLALPAEIARFREMLDRPAIRTVLSRGGYDDPSALGFADEVCRELKHASLELRVWRERTFAMREADAVLSGSIDRLVLLCDNERPLAADVLDFKTDALDASDATGLAARVEHYRPQLEAYRRATSRLTGLEPARISARLLFVGTGAVCRVSAGSDSGDFRKSLGSSADSGSAAE